MMASPLFDVDLSDLISLRKWYKRAPKEFLRGSAGLLNDLAFGTKAVIPEEIDRKMVVRNPRFVSSNIRVKRANSKSPLNQQESIVGSIYRGKFTGWEEQELGTTSKKSRTHSLLSRGGSKSGIVRNRTRMRPGKQFPTPQNFPGKSKAHRALVMLIMLNRKNNPRPFIVTGLQNAGKGFPRIKDGLYEWRGENKLRQLQRFEDQPIKPKRTKWMSKAREAFMSSVNITKLWTKHIHFITKKFKR